MGASEIEWTEYTWNPIRARRTDERGRVLKGWHCEHVSPGCENCYAEKGFNMRMGTKLPFKPGHRKDVEIFLDEDMLLAPLKWKKPRRVFCCSMTDLFGEFVKDEWIDRMFAVMALCPQHRFQVLTKRARRMRAYCCDEQTPHRIARVMDEISATQTIGQEEIRPIEQYPGYLVSSHGHIYSEKRGTRRKLKPDASDKGHLRVPLYRNGDKSYERVLVHRLVLEAFVGPAPSAEAQGRHIDRNPENNAVSNLVWGDQEANWSDSKRHGTHRRYSKLTAEQAVEIKRRFEGGESGASLGRAFGISDTQARNIGTGKQWAVAAPIEWPLPNCWKGVSAEDQERADERIPDLLATPAAVRFVSLEPLLGPITLWGDNGEGLVRGPGVVESGGVTVGTADCPPEGYDDSYPGLDWVIVGGESGRNARPMHPDWARSLRDQCAAAGVAFFHKQNGEFASVSAAEGTGSHYSFSDGATVRRVGKKIAGRLLDGMEHNGMPA